VVAEDFPDYADIPEEQWINDSSGDDARAGYAVDVTKRSADAIDSAVTSLQEKAASVTNLAMPLIPVAIAVLGFALAQWPNPFAFIASALFSVVIIFLIGGAVLGYLASGARLMGGVNARRLAPAGGSPTLGELRAKEADAWLMSTELGFQMIERRNRDLFAARRAVAWAFVVATLATVFFVIAETQSGEESSSTITITLERDIQLDIEGLHITLVPTAQPSGKGRLLPHA
jgi:hypothetical protein